MKTGTAPYELFERYLQIVLRHRRLFQVPTVAIGILGTLYALFHSSTWQASQGLIVRDEAVGELSRYGRFDTTDQRKAAQETVLQIARNRQVISNAIQQLTPPEDRTPEGPDEGDISGFQDCISVTAPKGAEFGQSEMIYLTVKGRSADDAIERTNAVCDQLEKHLQQLRRQRAQSLIQELTEKLKLTQQNLNEATSRLEKMEREVGSDLGELRTLNQSGTGESNLRTSLSQIKSEMRNARSTLTAQEELLRQLKAAKQDPKSLIATPLRLLDSQPALKRLREGLVDAQLRLADLQGKMHESHPAVRAAMKAEQEIRDHLFQELDTAIRGTEADLKLTQALIESYDRQCSDVQIRLDRLAGVRARYEILIADVQDRSSQVKAGQRALAEARASLEAAVKSSFITRVDHPEAGDGPLGPGRLTLMLGAWIGGAMVGLGLVFLISNSPETMVRNLGRRWSDQAAADNSERRRASDRTQPVEQIAATSTGRRASDRFIPDSQETTASPTDRPMVSPASPSNDGRAVAAPFPQLEVPAPTNSVNPVNPLS